jgi:hypothetical protein
VGWAALRPNHSSKRDSPTGSIVDRRNTTPLPCLALSRRDTGECAVTFVALCFNQQRCMDSLPAMLIMPTASC